MVIPPTIQASAASDDTMGAARSQHPDHGMYHSGTVYRVDGWRKWLLLFPFCLLLKLYFASLRVRVEPAVEAVRDEPRALVGIGWHNRSFVTPLALGTLRKPSKCFCLISPSKAAAWEDAAFGILGINSVRGSSSRRSIQAMRELVRISAAGNDVLLTPDGPSGPIYQFKRGAAVVARLTGCPVLLIGVECKSAWRPHTWDRHLFPLPFSKVVIKWRMLENEEVFDGIRDDDAAAEYLAGELKTLNRDFFGGDKC